MFYLVEFFSFLKQRPLIAFFQIMLFGSLLNVGILNDRISKNIFPKKVKEVEYKHFYALLAKKHNVRKVARKLRDLPGIQEVQIFKEDHIKRKVSAVLKNFKTSIVKNAPSIEQNGLKISFTGKTSERAVTLVKEYIARLVGQNDVVIGPTKEPKTRKVTVAKKGVIRENFKVIIYSILFILWGLSSVMLLRPLKKRAYVISKFQRRSSVSLKMISLFYLPIVCVSAIIGISIGVLEPMDFLFIGLAAGLIHVPFLRGDKWNVA